MILAAADCAERKSPAPRELRYVFDWQAWGVLPAAGGQLDQPAGLLERMRAAWQVYRAVRSWNERDKSATAKWKKEHGDLWEIVEAVRKLRKQTLG